MYSQTVQLSRQTKPALATQHRITKNLPSRMRTALYVLLALPLFSACSSDDDTTLADAEQSISWGSCQNTDNSENSNNDSLECATLAVPLDYSNADGQQISIALSRHAATGDRKGILLLNPGGPGGSGVEFVEQVIAESLFPDRIVNEFDLVSFDPRGVGASSEIICGEQSADALDAYPQDSEGMLELLTATEQVSNDCVTQHGDLILHVGSNNVARDMDRIRAAMNESQLNFIGYSYGTRLGSLYLQLFPQHAGKLVLDASLPPTADVTTLMFEQTQQMQTNFTNWLSGCTETDQSCDPTAIEAALVQQVSSLFEAMESGDPQVAERAMAEGELLAFIIPLAVSEPEFGELALAPMLSYLESNDVQVLQQFIEFIQSFVGDELADEEDGVDAPFRAIACADDSSRPGSSEYLQLLEQFTSASNLLGALTVSQAMSCNGWPAAVDPVQPISITSDGQVVVIGGAADPATPLVWSERMAAALNSPLIVSDHVGHTIVFSGTNKCVDDQVIAFLLDDTMPQTLSCSIDP